MSEWHERVEPLTLDPPTSERGHDSLDPRLHDEDKAFGVGLTPVSFPAQALAGDVVSVLRRWQNRFF